ncbi:unnamed protein product [Darwinula stevensoni]|uniref:E2F/DP family winged-helix DNA-binding domain-containing protein n=1 Tax=Darwinula stevensoni TaxID=69355 RepID=A0A7R8X5T4_9CRUS|nr:unnamed protein product [Darwinula stevensoni]CAG0880431.1 unnamed protein product [Darwinula stevensoni]
MHRQRLVEALESATAAEEVHIGLPGSNERTPPMAILSDCALEYSGDSSSHGWTVATDSGESLTKPLTPSSKEAFKSHMQPREVRRRLELDDGTSIPIIDISEFKTPQMLRRRTTSTGTPRCSDASPVAGRSPGCRKDASLVNITKRFMTLVDSSPDRRIDINRASITLGVQKRRIYDITNVLEGIGVLQKESKNTCRWKGTLGDGEDADASGVLLREELEDLNEKENTMDQMIAEAEEELGRLKGGAGSYVTYSDLKGIPLFQNKTVIVIQAPPDALWESSPPGGQNGAGGTLRIKSESSEIEVFMCPTEVAEPSESNETISSSGFVPDSSQSHSQVPFEQELLNSPPTASQLLHSPPWSSPALSSPVKFLDARFGTPPRSMATPGPSRIKEERDDLSSLSLSMSETFLSLEPPLADSEYAFTLDGSEGLTDLFDFDLLGSSGK